MRYFASLKATAMSNYACFGIGGIFTFWKNLVYDWPEYFLQFGVLWPCDQSSLGTHLDAETQPLPFQLWTKN